MTVLSPRELKSLCDEHHLYPSKQYGQNYLISEAPIKKIIEAAELSQGDIVVEIGPGFGILTFNLAPLVKKVTAFEIEKKLMPYWQEKQKQYPNVEIIWGNALQQIKIKSENLKGNYKVVANLPYQITSNVLRTLLEAENKPERIIIMVQKEVAERICAKPRSTSSRQGGDMSLLAVSVQYYGEPKIVAQVSRGNFWPSPQVDSAVLAINKINRKNNSDDEYFFKVVRAGFAVKRKQLWHNLCSNLKLDKKTVQNILKNAVGDEKIRAEMLSVADWRGIVDKLRIL